MSSPYDNACDDKRSGGGSKSASSSSSESSSTEEEERLKRLFQSCDRDGDGFIDSHDLLHMCRLLNMEDAVDEIMQQLGVGDKGRISFHDFVHCRMRLINEIEQEQLREDDLGASVRLPHTSTMAVPGSSDNSLGLPPSSQDYDSGARDMSPEPSSLYQLLEKHSPQLLHRYLEYYDNTDNQIVPNILEKANSLHLGAMRTLREEMLDLNTRLQLLRSDNERMEKQLNRIQTERLRIQREAELGSEQQTLRYEERITELHSVIAELRKKLARHQISIIREEEEYEESDGMQSNRSPDEAVSINENNANISQATSLAEIGTEINEELSRVVLELESALEENSRSLAVDRSKAAAADQPPAPAPATNDKALQVSLDPDQCQAAFDSASSQQPGDLQLDLRQCQEQLQQLQADKTELQQQLALQEADVNKLKGQLPSIREERDRFKRRVRELSTRVQSLEVLTTSPHSGSWTHSPAKAGSKPPLTSPGHRPGGSSSAETEEPITKIAELKKLKTGGSDRHVLGAELSAAGLPSAKVAEHLVQSLTECSNVQEIIQTVYHCGNQISENKIREFEIELERLQSKIDHLKSQSDLLNLTLEESKTHCNRLTVLIGKYESNHTAMHMAMTYLDQALEASQVLVSLLDSERGVLLANCRAAGLGALTGGDNVQVDQEEVTSILQKAHHSRKTAEHVAKQLLQRFDRDCSGTQLVGCTASPWEDLSSNSRTASTASSTGSSVDAEWSKVDEKKLRDTIEQLQNERAAVRLTVMELESVHLDPLGYDPSSKPEAQRLDLENAVLMQELMAMKEEKAELKAQNYLMEKEKSSLELHLSGKESQEQAYLVQIEHLKSEITESQDQLSPPGTMSPSQLDSPDSTPAITLAELRSHDVTRIAQDLSESLKREKKLKARVQELVGTLEKLSRNSEIRHQQSAEFVNDLKRANSALISAFEKAKKKYQSKVKKLESQVATITDRYEAQVRLMKQRVKMLEEECAHSQANETSL